MHSISPQGCHPCDQRFYDVVPCGIYRAYSCLTHLRRTLFCSSAVLAQRNRPRMVGAAKSGLIFLLLSRSVVIVMSLTTNFGGPQICGTCTGTISDCLSGNCFTTLLIATVRCNLLNGHHFHSIICSQSKLSFALAVVTPSNCLVCANFKLFV